MQEVQPDFESIYTPEYWGDIPDMHDFKRGTTIGKAFEIQRIHEFNSGRIPTWTVDYEIQKALGRSAMEIYVGGSKPTPIPDDAIVGGNDDNEYAVPGNILLLDTESAVLRPSSEPYRKQIQNEFELQASAIRIVKSSFKRETSFLYDPLSDFGPEGPLRSAAEFVLKPFMNTERREEEYSDPRMVFEKYSRALFNPDMGRYYRNIDLVAFFSAKDGKTGSRRGSKSFIRDSGGINTWLSHPVEHSPGRVGETINTAIRENVTVLQRTRSAYVCARGAFEYAPVKTKKKTRSAKAVPALSTN